MSHFFNWQLISTGLAIFSMFFGAGNLMYPIKVGFLAGQYTPLAMIAFLITGVFLPFAGLIAIILFQGSYKEFFYRLGNIPGAIFIFFCMFIIGPGIAMPRITTLSYTMMQPFMPFMPLWAFCVLFLALTFLATYKENKIVDLLGYVISPLLLISLFIIIIKGYLTRATVVATNETAVSSFVESFNIGYQTLDLLGGIFFAAVVIGILQKSFNDTAHDFKKLSVLSFKAGSLGLSLLALVYFGLSNLGAYFGHNLEKINEGVLFSTISFRVMGQSGAFIIALAVLMACYSTIIALAAVFAEFLVNVSNKKINYVPALIITLLLTLIPSIFGLGVILEFSAPLIMITYPSLVVLTLCNIAYKLFNFQWIKLPVAVTLLASIIMHVM